MAADFLAVAFTVVLLVATSVPLGRYMARVFTGEPTPLDPVLAPDRTRGAPHDGRGVERRADLAGVFAVAAHLESRHVAGDAGPSSRCSSTCRSIPMGSATWNQRSPSTPSRASRRTRICSTTAARHRPLVPFADVRDHVPAVRDRRNGHRRAGRRHPGAGRQPADDARQLLCGRHAGRGSRPAAAGDLRRHGLPDVAGDADDVRGRGKGDDRGRTGTDIARGVAAPWSPSSNWARTAAAFSARTPHIRSRTPRPSPTWSRRGRFSSFPMAMVWTLG